LNSCLYRCRVVHNRFVPKPHKFSYRVYMFYLDLDELDAMTRQVKMVSRNRFNIFGFYDQDHIKYQRWDGQDTKSKLMAYLRTNGIDLEGGRVYLLTYLRTLGYVFNPVSFYFCYDKTGEQQYAIAEVGNTYGEMKLFLLSDIKDGQAYKNEVKNFYVSPFIDLDASFNFKLNFPGERLSLFIDDYKEGQRIIATSLVGERQPLNDSRLLKNFLYFPLITIKVIGMIHWQAFLLWLKGLNYHPKGTNMHLQKGIANQQTKKVGI